MYRSTHDPQKQTSSKVKSQNKNTNMENLTIALPWSEDVPLF